MMSDHLKDLYQEVILDHNKNPRNFKLLDIANRKAEGYNPLCGDKVDIFVLIEDDVIKDIGFRGAGCAISTASASIMTEAVKGKTLAQARALFKSFHGLVTGEGPKSPELPGEEKLAVFRGVREFPVRVKCATLAWHTLKAALENESLIATTE